VIRYNNSQIGVVYCLLVELYWASTLGGKSANSENF